jgi:hypothetical protein
MKALMHEARDSIRPDKSARPPAVPFNDGSRLQTQQWSIDLESELNIQVASNQPRRKNARLFGRNTLNKLGLTAMSGLHEGTEDYTREARLRVRNCLRQTSASELPIVSGSGTLVGAPAIIKDVHSTTLTNWVTELHDEFTWTPVQHQLPEDVETSRIKEPRAKHGPKSRGDKIKARQRKYSSAQILVGVPHEKDVELPSEFHGRSSFPRFQLASTAKAKRTLEMEETKDIAPEQKPSASSRTPYLCDMCGEVHEVLHCRYGEF